MEKKPVSFYIKFCWCREYYPVFRRLFHSQLHSSSLLRMTDVLKPRGPGVENGVYWSIVVRMVLQDCSGPLPPVFPIFPRDTHVSWRVGSVTLGNNFFRCSLKMATNSMLERNAYKCVDFIWTK